MNNLSNSEAYQLMFREYPDVVGVDELCKMLGGISIKTAYVLLQKKEVAGFKIGRAYKIPKISVIDYLYAAKKSCSPNDDLSI